MILSRISLIFIILCLNSCFRLYSYPSGNVGPLKNNSIPDMDQNFANPGRVSSPIMMPPDFGQNPNQSGGMPNQSNFGNSLMTMPNFQQNPMPNTLPPNFNRTAPQNQMDRYPGNVPNPYGMKRRINNNADRLVEDLEQYQEQPQYRGSTHYRSKEYKQSQGEY